MRQSLFSPTFTSPTEKTQSKQQQERTEVQAVPRQVQQIQAQAQTGPTPCPAGPSPVRNLERIYVSSQSSEKKQPMHTPKERSTPKAERNTPQTGKENDSTPSNIMKAKSMTPSKMPEIQITYIQKNESTVQPECERRAFGQRVTNQNNAMECY
jgi:hypothetical protein